MCSSLPSNATSIYAARSRVLCAASGRVCDPAAGFLLAAKLHCGHMRMAGSMGQQSWNVGKKHLKAVGCMRLAVLGLRHSAHVIPKPYLPCTPRKLLRLFLRLHSGWHT